MKFTVLFLFICFTLSQAYDPCSYITSANEKMNCYQKMEEQKSETSLSPTSIAQTATSQDYNNLVRAMQEAGGDLQTYRALHYGGLGMVILGGIMVGGQTSPELGIAFIIGGYVSFLIAPIWVGSAGSSLKQVSLQAGPSANLNGAQTELAFQF